MRITINILIVNILIGHQDLKIMHDIFLTLPFRFDLEKTYILKQIFTYSLDERYMIIYLNSCNSNKPSARTILFPSCSSLDRPKHSFPALCSPANSWTEDRLSTEPMNMVFSFMPKHCVDINCQVWRKRKKN